MSNNKLKHIMVYEAFEAQAISKTITFLKKELGNKYEVKKFISSLKSIKNTFDISINEINNDQIEYLSKKEALNIRNTKGEISNEWGIYCLKFWFSVEKGFMGYTGTGDKIIKNGDKREPNMPFNKEELDYLMNHNSSNMININSTGVLKPIEDYSEIKHLDKIAGYFNDDNNVNYLTAATAWLTDDGSSENPRLNAIQNRHGVNNRSGNWEDYGRRSWGLGRLSSPTKDHFKLHKYYPGNEPLKVVFDPKEEEVIDVYDYNLPLSTSSQLTRWGNAYTIDGVDKVKNSDFCIIIYLDDILKKSGDKLSPSSKVTNRISMRKGATSFIDDSEIKKENINRYTTGILKKLGVTDNKITTENLQKVISKTLFGDFALMSCKMGYINRLGDFNARLNNFMICIEDGLDESRVKSRYKDVLDLFKTIFSESSKRKKLLDENMKKVLDYYSTSDGGEDILNTLNKIFAIGNKISESVKKHKVESLSDLKIINHKLRSIRSIIDGDDNDFSIDELESPLQYLSHISETDDLENTRYYLDRITTSRIKIILRNLDNIDRYVTDIFR